MWERILIICSKIFSTQEFGEFSIGGRWTAERAKMDPPNQSNSYYREQIALAHIDEVIYIFNVLTFC